MARLGSFLVGIAVGGAAVFTGLKYHVVRANDGVHLVPKLQAQFDEAYVDIRKFTCVLEGLGNFRGQPATPPNNNGPWPNWQGS